MVNLLKFFKPLLRTSNSSSDLTGLLALLMACQTIHLKLGWVSHLSTFYTVSKYATIYVTRDLLSVSEILLYKLQITERNSYMPTLTLQDFCINVMKYLYHVCNSLNHAVKCNSPPNKSCRHEGYDVLLLGRCRFNCMISLRLRFVVLFSWEVGGAVLFDLLDHDIQYHLCCNIKSHNRRVNLHVGIKNWRQMLVSVFLKVLLFCNHHSMCL